MAEPVMRELYSAEEISAAVRRLGREISADHPSGDEATNRGSPA